MHKMAVSFHPVGRVQWRIQDTVDVFDTANPRLIIQYVSLAIVPVLVE
jgi:hypothetical protein